MNPALYGFPTWMGGNLPTPKQPIPSRPVYHGTPPSPPSPAAAQGVGPKINLGGNRGTIRMGLKGAGGLAAGVLTAKLADRLAPSMDPGQVAPPTTAESAANFLSTAGGLAMPFAPGIFGKAVAGAAMLAPAVAQGAARLGYWAGGGISKEQSDRETAAMIAATERANKVRLSKLRDNTQPGPRTPLPDAAPSDVPRIEQPTTNFTEVVMPANGYTQPTAPALPKGPKTADDFLKDMDVAGGGIAPMLALKWARENERAAQDTYNTDSATARQAASDAAALTRQQTQDTNALTRLSRELDANAPLRAAQTKQALSHSKYYDDYNRTEIEKLKLGAKDSSGLHKTLLAISQEAIKRGLDPGTPEYNLFVKKAMGPFGPIA